MKNEKGSGRKGRLAAEMLWSLLASWKRSMREGRTTETWRKDLPKELTDALAADVGLVVRLPEPGPLVQGFRAIEPDFVYTRAFLGGTEPAPRSTTGQWSIPWEEELFAFDDDTCRIFEGRELFQDQTGYFGQLETLIRGRAVFGGMVTFLVLGWFRSPQDLSMVHQYGKTLVEMWLGVASASERSPDAARLQGEVHQLQQRVLELTREVTDLQRPLPGPATQVEREEELVAALQEWLDEHENPDQPVLIVGRDAFSPRQLVAEVRRRSPFGQDLRAKIVQDAVANIRGTRNADA